MRRIVFGALLGLSILCAPPCRAADAGPKNLIRNGGFETDNGQGAPAGWRASTANSTWAKDLVHSGAHSAKVVTKTGEGTHWGQFDIPIVPGGKKYQLSFYVMTEKFGMEYYAYIETAKNNGFGFSVTGISDQGQGLGIWHKKSVLFDMPAPGAADSLYLILTAKGDATVWYDDVEITEMAPVELPAMEIKLFRPCYRNTIYASETAPHIAGEVVFNRKFAAQECEVQVADTEGLTFSQAKFPLAADQKSVGFDFSVDTLPIGEFIVTASCKETGAEKAMTISVPLRRIGAMPGEIRIREDNVLLIEGKPFFPIGLWSWYNMAEAAAAGFNLLRGGDPATPTPSVFRAQLEQMEEYGLKTYNEIYLLDRHKDKGESGIKGEKAEEFLRGLALVKGNTTFIGWALDEPVWGGTSLNFARDLYQLIAANDPFHINWVNHAPRNTIADLAAWNRFADVTGCDIYPAPGLTGHSNLPNPTISVVGDETIKQMKTVEGRKPVWMVLQGFDWKVYSKEHPTATSTPTWEQTRFMAYDAIINGAKGVIWWGGARPESLWAAMKRTAGELRDISAVLVSPDNPAALKIDCKEPDQVRYLLKKCENNAYLLVENRSDKELAVTFNGIPAAKDSLKVVFEDRAVPLKAGVLSDTFAPYAIHIYTDAAALPAPLVPTTPAARKFAEDETEVAALVKAGWLSRDWNAEWIWYPDKLKTDDLTIYARKAFSLEAKPEHAWIHLTVDDQYVLYVNGKEVKASGWGTAYDIAQYLVAGKNVVALKAYNKISYAGILLQGMIGSEQSRAPLLTDSSWKVSLTPDEGWMREAFDDSGWKNAFSIGKPPVQPWGQVPLYLGH